MHGFGISPSVENVLRNITTFDSKWGNRWLRATVWAKPQNLNVTISLNAKPGQARPSQARPSLIEWKNPTHQQTEPPASRSAI